MNETSVHLHHQFTLRHIADDSFLQEKRKLEEDWKKKTVMKKIENGEI